MAGEIETAAAIVSSALTRGGATELYRHRGNDRSPRPPWKESAGTLWVKSKQHGKALCYQRFESQRACGHASGDTHSHRVGDGPPRLNQQSLPWFNPAAYCVLLAVSCQPIAQTFEREGRAAKTYRTLQPSDLFSSALEGALSLLFGGVEDLLHHVFCVVEDAPYHAAAHTGAIAEVKGDADVTGA
jgi:hypothetical protein